MEQQVTVMQWYVVTGTAGATVSTPEDVTLCTIPDGGQGSFFAITPIVVTSDASVSVVKATFNYAPAKAKVLGLLGGGVSALPAGYLAAEFLESTGKECIDTDILWKSSDVLRLDYETITDNPNYNIFGYNNNYRFLNTSVVQMTIKNSAIPFSTPLTKGKHYLLFDTTYRYEFDGEEREGYRATWTAGNLTLFSISSHTYNAVIRFYKFTHENEAKVKLLPAISQQGEPCLIDTVSKKAYKNNGAGAFIVGMTLSQARKLGKLPAGGGTLKVSLPSNYLENEGVVNAIAEANAKGWNIEVASTWDASAASATFALRRIWVRKTQAEQGNYVDADGTRWAVESCVAMYNVDGSEPDAHGYEPFRSVDAAVAYWELQPYVNPDDEILTEPTTNEYE